MIAHADSRFTGGRICVCGVAAPNMIAFTEEANGVLTLMVCDPEECGAILEDIRKFDEWEDATVRVEEDNELCDSVAREVRSASVMPLSYSSPLFTQFEEKMTRVVKPLIKQHWGVDLKDHSGVQVVRYSSGGRYLTHQDAAMDFEDRYFTFICYLNDDFKGGRTRFPSLSYTAVPASGKAIVFPAKYFHCAEPVLEGEKYVVVGWVLGPIPIRWI